MTAKKKPSELKKNQKPKTETLKITSADVPEKTPEKKRNVVDRPTVEILPVKLTDEEVTAFARESARLHGALEGVTQEKKSVMADFKGREGALVTRIAELNRKISGGTEDRQVACFWRIDYDANKKTLYRSPASPAEQPEEVTSYSLSPSERQMQLPMAETKNDKAVSNLADMNAEDVAKHPLTATIAEALKASKTVIPAPGDSTGTDDVRTPAAESPEETKARKWFNVQSVDGRKVIFGTPEDEVLSDDRTRLPYKRLPESDREIIRKAFSVSAIPF